MGKLKCWLPGNSGFQEPFRHYITYRRIQAKTSVNRAWDGGSTRFRGLGTHQMPVYYRPWVSVSPSAENAGAV